MAVWMALIWSAWNEGIIFLAMGLVTGVFHGIFVVRRQRVRVQEMAIFDEPVQVRRDGQCAELWMGGGPSENALWHGCFGRGTPQTVKTVRKCC